MTVDDTEGSLKAMKYWDRGSSLEGHRRRSVTFVKMRFSRSGRNLQNDEEAKSQCLEEKHRT